MKCSAKPADRLAVLTAISQGILEPQRKNIRPCFLLQGVQRGPLEFCGRDEDILNREQTVGNVRRHVCDACAGITAPRRGATCKDALCRFCLPASLSTQREASLYLPSSRFVFVRYNEGN
jgi:hypothetical protein